MEQYEQTLREGQADLPESEREHAPDFEREGYRLVYTQAIDGIPCMPYYWTHGSASEEKYSYVNLATFFVCQEGISEASTCFLVSDLLEEKKVVLLDYDTITSSFCSDLDADVSDAERTVIGADLYYLPIVENAAKGEVRLIPVYVFTVSESGERYDATYGGIVTYFDYLFYLYDAESGERIF